jgi:phosphoserine aminotransferase
MGQLLPLKPEGAWRLSKLLVMSDIKIPADLLPIDGRFGCGPSKVRQAQLDAFASEGAKLMGTSHRQAPVKNLVKRVQEGLMDLFHNPEGYEIVMGNGGSTAFWDVASFGLAEGKAQALVHGEFGSKFASSLSAPWLTTPTVINGTPGSRLQLQAEAGVSLYAYAQNETSTGVVTPVERLSGADSGALFLTDATSAAGGIDFDPLATDVYYFAPQKNFASDGGLWFALMSPAAIERAERIAASNRYIPDFLSLKQAIDNSRLNQTLNTPAISTLFLLAEQTDWMNENGGLAWADSRTKAASSHLYEWAESSSFATPFVANPEHRSQVVVTIDFNDGIDAAAIAKVLRANGVVDTEPYRKLGRNQLRVATFTATDLSDVQQLTKCIDYVVSQLG